MPDPINLQEIREHLAYWDHGKTDDPTVPMKHSWVLALLDATEAARGINEAIKRAELSPEGSNLDLAAVVALGQALARF